jgi:Rrf2 family transcriptional regulator, cysteine metabolism repressor
MNISVKGEYALHAIFDLSSQPPGQPVKIADIARRQNIPQKFLELILSSLKQGGFVESRRGAEGGYLLARPPSLITIGEVFRFFEGGQNGKSRAKRRSDSPFQDLWRQVDDAVSSIVDKTTFADLLRSWTEKHDTFVPNWEI